MACTTPPERDVLGYGPLRRSHALTLRTRVLSALQHTGLIFAHLVCFALVGESLGRAGNYGGWCSRVGNGDAGSQPRLNGRALRAAGAHGAAFDPCVRALTVPVRLSCMMGKSPRRLRSAMAARATGRQLRALPLRGLFCAEL
jgi:hypothetical protein